MTLHIIDPGSEIDLLPFGQLCARVAREIVVRHPDHRFHRLDLFRIVEYGGRSYHVKVRFTLPFATLIEDAAP
jgi:hypothetical protein